MLDPRLAVFLETFKQLFLQAKGLVHNGADEQEWNIYPSVVRTEFASFQEPHLDFNPKDGINTWILHFPIQKEGAIISVYDHETFQH